jgi:ribulose-phosphate 3-epimerase
MRAGVALAVCSGVEAVVPLLQAGAVDMVLCMTVECGFGGQKFQEQVLEKVRLFLGGGGGGAAPIQFQSQHAG